MPPSSMPLSSIASDATITRKAKKDPNADDEFVPPEENLQLQRDIHSNLAQAYIGTLRLYETDLETNWQIDDPNAHSNRLVDQEGVDRLVQEFEAGNCRRLDPDNHMKATTTRENAIAIFETLACAGLLTMMSDGMKVSDVLEYYKKQVFGLNGKADYPLLSPAAKAAAEEVDVNTSIDRVMLQAGQHRLKALAQWCQHDVDEQWWPVKLYLHDELSLASIETLRINKTTVVLDLSDGERACQIWDYKHDIKRLMEQKNISSLFYIVNRKDARERADHAKVKAIENNISQIEAAIEVKMSEFKAGSRAKATGLLRPKDIKANFPLMQSIVQVCRLPGLARDFSFAALGELQALRITDVTSIFPYIYPISKSTEVL